MGRRLLDARRGYHYSISSMHEIVVPSQESAKKLENFLKKEFPIGYVRKLMRKNGVRINGQRARANDLVRPGDRIQLYVEFQNKASAVKTRSATKLETIYQDDSLLVIDKPAGIAVHEGKSVRKQDSVLGMLEANYRGTDIRPQLVHRLDKDTSGLLLIAKNSATAKELESRFQHGDVEKEYFCLVKGRLPLHEGNIDFPLPGRQGKPVPASTRYRVSRQFSDATLVRVKIDTGRLHQIRLHFATLGYPVIMDEQHGDFAFNRRFRKQFGLKRQFLHAEKLTLRHAGILKQWTAPLPKDLTEVLKRLSSRQP